MFNKVNIQILGVIENMNLYKCPNCQETNYIFGGFSTERLAKKYHTKILGSLPLKQEIAEDADRGRPSTVKEEDTHISFLYRSIALNITFEIAKIPKAPIHIPNVKVEYD